jgi:hypothetical protein
MSYKGNDLDLRTPYAVGVGEEVGGQQGLSFLQDVGRDGPIPVDHTLVACCNAAYDAALFHGTRDVRLEHLLYALTRVEAAREVLEQHGVRTQQLRRETAAAVAAEAPTTGAGNRNPRASAELEHLLRRAAGRAGEDSVPASVHDILRVALSYGREAPATALLPRSASDPQQLGRWAAEAKPRVPQPGAGLPAAVAQEVVGRLETLEITMRTLVAEVAADRKAMLDMLGELQHELRAARQETAQPAIVLEKIEDVGKSVVGLSERFDTIRALAPTSTVESRLAALESRIAEQPGAIANAIAYMLDERRAADPEPLQLTATDVHVTEVSGKLANLESMLRTQWARIEEGSKAHERDLNELFEAMVKVGSNQQTLADNLEAWRLDNAGDVSIVSNRLKELEQMLHEVLPAQVEGSRSGSLKRWLYGTASVLPTTWRSDAAALRESLRSARNSDKN